MSFGTWDTVYNALVFVVWFRIWSEVNRDVLFNPYLAPLQRVTDSIVHFVRSALPLPPRLIASLAVVILLMLRGLAMPGNTEWSVALGFERMARLDGALAPVIFSFLSFAVFLFKFWGISMIYIRDQTPPSDRAGATLYHLARPFTAIPREARPFVLLFMGSVLVALMDTVGRLPMSQSHGVLSMTIGWGQASSLRTGVELSVLALAGWIQLLLVLQQLTILLIIASWVGIFIGVPGLLVFCREWLDMLFGPLRRYNLRLGMFDLTPIVFILALMILHDVLMWFLLIGYGVLT